MLSQAHRRSPDGARAGRILRCHMLQRISHAIGIGARDLAIHVLETRYQSDEANIVTKSYAFTFSMLDNVTVVSLQAKGTVAAVMLDIAFGSQYRVVYYINNERRDQWMHEFELSPA